MSTLTRNSTVAFTSDSGEKTIVTAGTELGLNGGVAYCKKHWTRQITAQFKTTAALQTFMSGLTEANGGVVVVSDYNTGAETVTGGTYYLASDPSLVEWLEDVNTGRHCYTYSFDLIRWE